LFSRWGLQAADDANDADRIGAEDGPSQAANIEVFLVGSVPFRANVRIARSEKSKAIRERQFEFEWRGDVSAAAEPIRVIREIRGPQFRLSLGRGRS
jgi:hypothetical protein